VSLSQSPGEANIRSPVAQLQRVSRLLRRPVTTTLRLRLGTHAVAALRRRHHRVRLTAGVLFVPTRAGEPRVRDSTTLTLRR
jgi:hypothetical protein